jgi:hypothetical protein
VDQQLIVEHKPVLLRSGCLPPNGFSPGLTGRDSNVTLIS